MLGDADRRQQNFRYEYRLGHVVEAYDVRADGLEQTFVIAERPLGMLGDLVVEGAIESRMTVEAREPAHGLLEFYDESGDRIFTYGAAFAVDALGAKLPMATAYSDGLITLSLSAEDLETLTFPVTVDPLLGNVGLRAGNPLDHAMDCLREDEGTSNNLWYAYSRSAAINSGRLAVRGHIHDIGDTNLGVSITNVAGGAAISCWRPDVGGAMSFSTPSIVMVVYQHEAGGSGANSGTSSIVAQPLDCDLVHGAQGLLLPSNTLASSNSTDNERPRINQQASSAGYRAGADRPYATDASGPQTACVTCYLEGVCPVPRVEQKPRTERRGLRGHSVRLEAQYPRRRGSARSRQGGRRLPLLRSRGRALRRERQPPEQRSRAQE